MDTLILKSNSKDDLQLFFKLAKKVGIFAKFLSKDEKEDIAIAMAIENGKTGEYIDKSFTKRNYDHFLERINPC